METDVQPDGNPNTQIPRNGKRAQRRGGGRSKQSTGWRPLSNHMTVSTFGLPKVASACNATWPSIHSWVKSLLGANCGETERGSPNEFSVWRSTCMSPWCQDKQMPRGRLPAKRRVSIVSRYGGSLRRTSWEPNGLRMPAVGEDMEATMAYPTLDIRTNQSLHYPSKV